MQQDILTLQMNLGRAGVLQIHCTWHCLLGAACSCAMQAAAREATGLILEGLMDRWACLSMVLTLCLLSVRSFMGRIGSDCCAAASGQQEHIQSAG